MWLLQFRHRVIQPMTLSKRAKEINPNASKREMDMLLSTGEQISISLLAMAIEKTRLSGYFSYRLAGRR